MGLFGGGNSSSSSNTQNYNDSKNFNQQDTEGVAVSAGGNVTVLDSGAIGSAFDLARASLESVDHVTEDAYGFGRESLVLAGEVVDTLAEHTELVTDTVGSYADKAIQQVASSTRSDTADTLQTLTKWVAGALGIMGVVYVMSRSKK